MKRKDCVVCGGSLSDKSHKAALYCSDACKKSAYDHRERIKRHLGAVIEDIQHTPRMPASGSPDYWHEVIAKELEKVELSLQAKLIDIAGSVQTSYILTDKGRAMLSDFRSSK